MTYGPLPTTGTLACISLRKSCPTTSPGQGPDTGPAARQRLLASNCGFEKAEHLPPNIGYVKFNVFADPEIWRLPQPQR